MTIAIVSGTSARHPTRNRQRRRRQTTIPLITKSHGRNMAPSRRVNARAHATSAGPLPNDLCPPLVHNRRGVLKTASPHPGVIREECCHGILMQLRAALGSMLRLRLLNLLAVHAGDILRGPKHVSARWKASPTPMHGGFVYRSSRVDDAFYKLMSELPAPDAHVLAPCSPCTTASKS